MKRILCLFLTLSTPAFAQLDSSSAVLLRPSSGKAPAPTGLDSGRYKIRAPESRPIDDDDPDDKPGNDIPTPVPAKTVKAKPEPKPAKTETPTPVPAAEVQAEVLEPEPPPVTTQVKQLILGATQDIEEYNRRAHPQDPRANVVEISAAPAYFYQGSSSSYSYRDYSLHGPGFGLGMNVWFTPFFGFQSTYFASVGSSVHGGNNNQVPATVQQLEIGVRFRKHFGYSRKAAHLMWGFDFYDAGTNISHEATTTVGSKSSGVGLALEGNIPSSSTYANTFRVDVRPRLHHSEQATGVDVDSGTKAQTDSLALALGGQWTLDRRNQVFWKGQYSVERNLFGGEASAPDAHSGVAPNGVSVTNSRLMFYFGFKWGS